MLARGVETGRARDCLVQPLEPGGRVLWLGAVSASEVRTGQRVTLVRLPPDERGPDGRVPDARILGVELERRAPTAPASRRLVPGAELLPARTVRAFGAVERVRFTEEGAAVAVSCAAGAGAAGIALGLNGTAAAGARMEVAIEAGGDADFGVRVLVDEPATSALPTRFLPVDGNPPVRLALPPTGEPTLAVFCPAAAGRLRLVRVAIASAAGALAEPAAAWVWNEESWRSGSANLLDWARRRAVGALFIAVTVERGEVRDAAVLADFIARARARDVSVVAVEGDPAMIAGAGRALALERAAAFAAYQTAHPAARLAGLQYDIEPYVAAGFAADTTAAWRAWAETLTGLSSTFGDGVDAVVPFWMLDSPGGADALAAAAPVLRHLTIMAYRTDVAATVAAAAPLLSWASANGIAATVALEAGPLPAERRDVFFPAATGELHVHRMGDIAAVVLMDKPLPSPHAGVHRRQFTVRSDPARLTFAGHPERLAQAVRRLSGDLSAWPAARRIAIHGLADAELAAAIARTAEEFKK